MPEDLKLLQIGSSQLPPPFKGLHSPRGRKHCQIIFACYFRKSSITVSALPTQAFLVHCIQKLDCILSQLLNSVHLNCHTSWLRPMRLLVTKCPCKASVIITETFWHHLIQTIETASERFSIWPGCFSFKVLLTSVVGKMLCQRVLPFHNHTAYAGSVWKNTVISLQTAVLIIVLNHAWLMH